MFEVIFGGSKGKVISRPFSSSSDPLGLVALPLPLAPKDSKFSLISLVPLTLRPSKGLSLALRLSSSRVRLSGLSKCPISSLSHVGVARDVGDECIRVLSSIRGPSKC